MNPTFDGTRWLGAAQRAVESGDYHGRPARTITLRRTYDAAIADVWDALTNPERIPRWFLPISGELRLGGRYQLEGNNTSGTITRCEPPTALAVTWEYAETSSWVEVQLSATAPALTMLELKHIAHIPDDFWAEYGAGAAGVGWDQALLGLGRYLETAAAVHPAAMEAWLGSASGVAFVQASSAAWCHAAIAAGENEATAQAAAQRTTAFYTPQPTSASPEASTS